MRTYETTIIIHQDIAGDAYTETVDKFKGILNELGANILAVEEWGTRKLAYIIRKQERGTYVLYAYEGKPEGIRELERRLRLDDKIIKFMTVQLEGEYEPSPFVGKSEESETVAPAAEKSAAEADKSEKPKAEEKAEEKVKTEEPAAEKKESAEAEAEEKAE